MRKKSIQDIAKELKISTTTVSLVLNGKADQYKISEKTQKKINDYVAEINYIPNAHARGLSSGKSYTIGYLVPDISNPFYARVGKVIDDILSSQGYQMMISSYDEDPVKESNIIKTFLSRQLDGLIIAPSINSSNTLQKVLAEKIPLVVFDREIKNLKSDYIGINNYESTHKPISELIKKGFNKIAMLTLTPEVTTIKERIEGFRSAFKDAGLALDDSLLLEVDFKDLKQSIHNKLTAVFEKHPDLKALFFVNNQCATNTLWVINKYFTDRIKELTLLSFDDIELFELTQPLISGIAQPRDMIATKAANLLLDKIKNPKSLDQKIYLETNTVWRS